MPQLFKQMSETPYVDAVALTLPATLSNLLASFDEYSRLELDTLVRFCVEAQCPDHLKGHNEAWLASQARLRERLLLLDSSLGKKRVRNDEETGVASTNGVSKKAKYIPDSDKEQDSESLFTFQSISVTSPVRKKVALSITKESIRLTNPSSFALEARIPVSNITRAFLISNIAKNKNKEQWTMVMICADTVSKSSDATAQLQLALSIEKATPGGKEEFKTSESGIAKVHPKGSETLPLLQQFLSQLPKRVERHIVEKGAAAFKSASGQPCVEAYRGAKEGLLCLLPTGILWANSKPCEFFALEDLAPDSDTPGLGGVKTLSATGRTVSMFVRRRGSVPDLSSGEEDIGDGDAGDGEEVEFAMIDGRESENVNAWIRKYRNYFGKSRSTEDGIRSADVKGKGKAIVEPEADEDKDSDESDEDFVIDSDSDGGEPTSESDNDEDGGDGDGGSGNGSSRDDDGASENDDMEEDAKLDPARHPLMRPGAMPKMSKAAMDAAVRMVTDDIDGEADAEEEDYDELD